MSNHREEMSGPQWRGRRLEDIGVRSWKARMVGINELHMLRQNRSVAASTQTCSVCGLRHRKQPERCGMIIVAVESLLNDSAGATSMEIAS